jgi:hypothetical protein
MVFHGFGAASEMPWIPWSGNRDCSRQDEDGRISKGKVTHAEIAFKAFATVARVAGG